MANVGETTGMNALVRMLGGAVGTQIVAVLITSNSPYGLPTLDGFTDAFVALGAFLLIAAFAARAVEVQSAARDNELTTSHALRSRVVVEIPDDHIRARDRQYRRFLWVPDEHPCRQAAPGKEARCSRAGFSGRDDEDQG